MKFSTKSKGIKAINANREKPLDGQAAASNTPLSNESNIKCFFVKFRGIIAILFSVFKTTEKATIQKVYCVLMNPNFSTTFVSS
jgi:hypothetical protein